MEKRDYKGPIENSIEMAIEKIENLLKSDYYLSGRSIAILLLQEDEEIRNLVKEKDVANFDRIEDIIKDTKLHYANPISYELAIERQDEVKDILGRYVKFEKDRISPQEKLSRALMNPLFGIPALLLVLYLGLYKFVGQFGAETVVNFLESSIFDKYVTPFSTVLAARIIPWIALQDLFIGEYGIVTMAFRYAFAIILPITAVFFLFFSLLEDSGYLPRLAMLIDRTFKKIGLSGRAVIPMVLGFGCATMATMVTRILPTKRERIIATLLLALAVPCSAQLGVIMALLQHNPKALLVWAGVILFIFLLVGYLTSKILPGERPSFYMEIPPLRIPSLSNVMIKTYVRVKWYFLEIMPLFLWASVLIWIGRLTRVFDLLINLLKGPVSAIGLPPEASKAFLFGFFRRDYGAAGLYDLNAHNKLDGVQLAVACVALTLFLPCIAQFLMNIKERGWKTGLGISVFILVFSFSVAYALNIILRSLVVVL
ncbi:MAG: nucleoside recognition domain-containing protein [Candidatus Omnitrophota bacterium]|nr:nucleoside recognition domain-containing protein [Candidatus Omnitrophota bacterium]